METYKMRLFIDTKQPNFAPRLKLLKMNTMLWVTCVCPVAFADGDIRIILKQTFLISAYAVVKSFSILMSSTTPPSPASSNTDGTPKRRVRAASPNIGSYTPSASQPTTPTTKRIRTSMSPGPSGITSMSPDLRDDDERCMCP